MLKQLKRLAHWKTFWRTLKTRRQAAHGGSDLDRWSDAANLKKSWGARTEQMAQYVPPQARVIEFGAGKQLLKPLLQDGQQYTPSDLVDRGPGTIVCDLNGKDLPRFPDQDVAFLAGVLEYINDLPKLAAHLHLDFQRVVTSYVVADVPKQADVTYRRSHGWVNELRADELIAIFQAAGYALEHQDQWKTQGIFVFVRAETANSN